MFGRSQFKAQKNNYLRELSIRRTEWQAASNVWDMKNNQYEIDTKNNVRAYTGHVGHLQRNFGLEVAEFMKNKESLFRQKTGKTPPNEGDRSTSFGRSLELASLYNEGAQAANIRRAGVKQGIDLRGAREQLVSNQSKALGARGFEPIPPPEPVRPKGPSYLDQAIGIASTAASFISPVQSIGKAAGLGLGGSGFWSKFFQG